MKERDASRPPIRLVVVTGPIGAGKTSVAELMARHVAGARPTVAVVDLDEVAFIQRGSTDLSEFWLRAGAAHAALVRGWFAVGTDLVVAHGPLFESRSYKALFAAAPADGRTLHVLLRVSCEQALVRVAADLDRPPGAISRDPEFLRSAHEAFAARERDLPTFDVQIYTNGRSPESIAAELARIVRS